MKNLLKLLPIIITMLHAGQIYGRCTDALCTHASVMTASPAYSVATHVTALFLKPTSNNTHYAVEAFPLPLSSPNWAVFSIPASYHTGFQIGVQTVIHERATTIKADWQRFRADACASKTVTTDNMIGPFFEIGPDASAYSKAHGTTHYAFDEGHIDYGQSLTLGCYTQVNLFVGITAASIKQKICSLFSNDDGSITRAILVPASFVGAGPQCGVDGRYCIVNNVSLTSSTVLSLLVGTAKNHTTYTATSPALADLGVTPPNVQHTCVQSSTAVVPAFEQSLGLSYTTKSLCRKYDITLETGYQVQCYLNPIQSIDMGSEVITPPVIPDTVGVFARTFHKSLSNFSLSGAYLLFSVGF